MSLIHGRSVVPLLTLLPKTDLNCNTTMLTLIFLALLSPPMQCQLFQSEQNDPQLPLTLQNFLKLHDYYETFTRCVKVIHYPGEYSTETFNSYKSALVRRSEPVVVNREVDYLTILKREDTWPARAPCQIRLVLSPFDFALPAAVGIHTAMQADYKAPLEYVLVVARLTKFHVLDIQIDALMQDRFKMTEPVFIQVLKMIHNWAIFITKEQGEKTGITMSHLYTVTLYCSSSEMGCLKSLKLDTEPLNLWNILFPRAVSAGSCLNYQLWPLLIFPIPAMKAVIPLKDYEFPKVFSSRLLYGVRPAASGYVILHACVEIARKINATLEPFSIQRASLSLSGIFPHLNLGGTTKWFDPLITGMLFLDFMHCKNDTRRFDGNALAAFYPFELVVWICMLVAVALLFAFFTFSSDGKGISVLAIASGLVGQAILTPKRFGCILILWLLVCFMLQSHYSCYIESLLVAPKPTERVQDFEDLHSKGFHILMPDSTSNGMTVMIRRGSESKFGGNSYVNALRESTIFVKGAQETLSAEYLRHLYQDEKGALVGRFKDVTAIKKAVNEWFVEVGGGTSCQQGLKQPSFALFMKTWTVMHPNGNVLKRLIHQYLVVGLLAYFEEIYERKMFEVVGKQARDALGFDVQGKKAVDAAHRQSEHGEGFTMKNSQTVVIFFAFLSGLALAGASFMLEMSVEIRPY